MTKPFTRERRYHILKSKDVEQLPAKHKQRLAQVEQAVFAIRRGRPLECVVVESDWPIYEATWQQIEAHSKGKPIIRDPNRVLSALCNSVVPAPMEHETVEDVAERVTRLSVSPFITEVEAGAIRNVIYAIKDTYPVVLADGGAREVDVLEDLLKRNGIAL